MKRISVFAVILLMVACAKPRKENNMMESDISIEASAMDTKEEFQYQNISKQKLQDLFDLLVLQKKHPKFNVEIANQLKKISYDSIFITDNVEAISIENIGIIEPIQQLTDSTQSLKIAFDVSSNLGITNDSLTVIITTNKIVIDEQELESTKLIFKKIN